MRPLTRSLGTAFSYPVNTPVRTRRYLLFYLCNDVRNIIAPVYQKTFMDGLPRMKERGVKGVIKERAREVK